MVNFLAILTCNIFEPTKVKDLSIFDITDISNSTAFFSEWSLSPDYFALDLSLQTNFGSPLYEELHFLSFPGLSGFDSPNQGQ